MTSVKIAIVLIFQFVFIKIFAQKAPLDTIPYALEYHQQRLELFKNERIEIGKIVFLGDSQIEFGDWKRLLGDTTIINRGVAGDNSYGVLARLKEIKLIKPSSVIIEIGINDVAKNIPNKVIVQNIRKIVHHLKTGSFKTKVFVVSILPTNDAVKKEYPDVFNKNEQVEEINTLLKKSTNLGFTYLNLHKLVINEKGKLKDNFADADGLHLNAQGYKVWADLVKNKLK